jgi:hypothetical protein
MCSTVSTGGKQKRRSIMTGFIEVSQNEMMEIDGGGWFRACCAFVGAVIGLVVAVKTKTAFVSATGLVIAGAACGDQVGKMVEDAYAI